MHERKEYLYSIYSKMTGILFEYIHGRRGAMVEAKGITPTAQSYTLTSY